MKKLSLVVIVFATLFTLSCNKKNDVKLQDNILAMPLSTNFVAQLDRAFDSTCKVLGIKGASAAVLIPNAGIWKGAYGESHTGAPIKSDMIMTIGSNTKTYIATLMLKLQEQGVLNINDTIGKWLKNVPYTNGKVTIKQLLNHTAGFGDFSYNPEFIAAIQSDFYRVWQPWEMYQFFTPPVHEPGTNYEYSDQHTLLAGIIIEKATGKPLKESMRQLVLGPANLINTAYYPFEQTSLTIPHSWSAEYNASGQLEDLNANYGYSTIAFCSADNAAGGMLATAEDNVLFWKKLMSGKIINTNSLTLMKQFEPTQAPNVQYGLCLVQTLNAYNGRTIYSHNGYVPGSMNDNGYDPKSGVCLSVLTNQDKVRDLSPILAALHKVTLSIR